MDEVEAALDDVNLHRFLGLVNEFRQDAQLVIVSHQKRTMEAGDSLLGVSMQPGGSSKVVTEKAIDADRSASTTTQSASVSVGCRLSLGPASSRRRPRPTGSWCWRTGRRRWPSGPSRTAIDADRSASTTTQSASVSVGCWPGPG